MQTLQTIVLVIHLFLAAGLIGLVLLQRSEGGALGLGGGGGGGLISGRGAANAMAQATTWIGALFFFTSLSLTFIAQRDKGPPTAGEIATIVAPTPAAPAAPAPTPARAGPLVAPEPPGLDATIAPAVSAAAERAAPAVSSAPTADAAPSTPAPPVRTAESTPGPRPTPAPTLAPSALAVTPAPSPPAPVIESPQTDAPLRERAGPDE